MNETAPPLAATPLAATPLAAAPQPDPATAALHCDGIRKRFGERTVLHDISLTLEPGAFVALLGLNGAGKTTLFQILTGLYTADAGALWVAGVHVARANQWPSALARMGVVFQQPALDLDLPVAQNLAFHAALHGIPAAVARARIQQLLTRFSLAERAQDHCRNLSGGMRRKIELARALLTEPRLLLMDEATVGLDPGSRVQLLDDVRATCRETGCAVLWATHLTQEVAQADRVIVLHQGQIRFSGTPAGLLAHTGKPEVESAFLGLTAARPGATPGASPGGMARNAA